MLTTFSHCNTGKVERGTTAIFFPISLKSLSGHLNIDPKQKVPALVAKLNACLTGDQEVAGSTPDGSATFFC